MDKQPLSVDRAGWHASW